MTTSSMVSVGIFAAVLVIGAIFTAISYTSLLDDEISKLKKRFTSLEKQVHEKLSIRENQVSRNVVQAPPPPPSKNEQEEPKSDCIQNELVEIRKLLLDMNSTNELKQIILDLKKKPVKNEEEVKEN